MCAFFPFSGGNFSKSPALSHTSPAYTYLERSVASAGSSAEDSFLVLAGGLSSRVEQPQSFLSDERRLSLLTLVHLMEQSTSGGDYSLPAVYFSSPAVLHFDFRETLTHKHIIRHAEGTDLLARFLSYPRQGNHQRCHFESNQFKEEGWRARACLCLYGDRNVGFEATRGSITANDLCKSDPFDGA